MLPSIVHLQLTLQKKRCTRVRASLELTLRLHTCLLGQLVVESCVVLKVCAFRF